MRWSTNLLVTLVGLAAVAAMAQTPTYNIGKTPSAEEIHAYDVYPRVGPDGKGLPPGSGTAKEGAKTYAQKCAACHGPKGAKGAGGPDLVGGKETLKSLHPVRTIGSFLPFATPVWDYINRAMPWNNPGTLSPNEVYALTALLLSWNGIIQENDVIDANSLPKIQMPNRNGFVPLWPADSNLRTKRPGGWFYP
jgi:S-disulfanyl-L-cysteine oxidoreductase SoxD